MRLCILPFVFEFPRGDVKTRKRTEISIETHRQLVIRRRKDSALAWCPECAAQVKMVTPEEAAIVACVSSRTIYRWVEIHKLHFSETSEGLLLICIDSVLPCSEVLDGQQIK